MGNSVNLTPQQIDQIDTQMEALARSSSYTHRIIVDGVSFHVAYSIMGNVKRCNVMEDENGVIPDEGEFSGDVSSYIYEKWGQ